MSARNLRLVLAPEARDDLRDALVFTQQRWDKNQRREYKQLLVNAFAELASFPELGRACPEFGAGIRSYRVGQHVVIYQATETEIRIARILHVRRDIDGALEETSS